MQQRIKGECPKCSRPLEKYNGHIGYCSLHKWVSPAGLGYDAEAAEQNKLDAINEEKSRIERERQKQMEKDRALQAQHESAVRKAIVAAVAVLLLAAAVVFFIVRPNINYNHASACFADGKFKQAQSEFTKLGNYKDSDAKAILSGAMLDLQAGRIDDATAKLEQLSQSGQAKLASQLADVMLPVMENWEANGLSPQSLLLLLSKIDLIDPKGTLDVSSLKIEAHTALLDGGQRAVYADDINNDQANELIVLNEDYSISVYRMTEDANVLLAVDNDTIAASAMTFGNAFMETDPSAAISCYSEAYRLKPDNDSISALVEAYQKRSSINENAGEWQLALDDAYSALSCSGTQEAFTYFYGVSLRYCKNGNDSATAIAMWETFAELYSADINKFSAQDQWNQDAAQMYIDYAIELASKKDDRCLDELRTANQLGADVTEPLATVQSCYSPGMMLAKLRLFELELIGDDAKQSKHVQAEMTSEVQTAISSWKELGIAPSDVPALIWFADMNQIDVSDIDRDAIYEEAVLASVGQVQQAGFVNWNSDPYKELLTMDANGVMQLYAVNESWQVVSTLETGMPNGSFTVCENGVPLILVLSENQDELMVLEGKADALPVIFKENQISRYTQNGNTITFSKELEGSIVRYSDYAYEATSAESRPVRTGVDWQKDNYPYPTDAQSTVVRYFEAVAYQIPEEITLLTQDAADDEGFTAAKLKDLVTPDIPGATSVVPYLIEDQRVLFEVEYTSGSQTIRTWIKAELDNTWKVTGTADAYALSAGDENVDYSVALIGLNGAVNDSIASRGERKTYRVYVTKPGRIRLEWQSGSKASTREAYAITMYQGSLTGDTVFSYVLQPSPNKQQSKDVFVSAGVYYVSVEARMNKAEAYTMVLAYEAETNVELESNDTSLTATPMKLNEEYSGVLSSAKDEDYFSFEIEQLSTVNVKLLTSGNGKKSVAYNCSIVSAADGQPLSAMQALGNVQQSESGNLYLQPGTYWVKVSKGSTHLNDEYRLMVSVTQADTTEAERNDTAETATAVPVNTDIHASIGQEGDIDWFTFTLDGDAVIQPRFGFTPADSTTKTYVLTLMDSSRREVLKANIGGKESAKVFIPAALPAGTYWVKIENPSYIRQDYTLHLVCMEVEAVEHEVNDSEALATEVAVGTDRTGVLTTRDDIDYYHMSFDTETLVTLSFSFAQSTSTDKVYVLTIEQNGKKQWSVAITGDSGGMEQQLQFPAGEYYLKVAPETWLSAVYTIGIH